MSHINIDNKSHPKISQEYSSDSSDSSDSKSSLSLLNIADDNHCSYRKSWSLSRHDTAQEIVSFSKKNDDDLYPMLHKATMGRRDSKMINELTKL